MAVELSFCVVNTEQRELLLRCLDAIARRAARRSTSRPRCSCSTTPRTTGRRAPRARHPATTEVIALEQRRGKGENDTALLQRARGPLLPAAQRGLRAAARRHGGAARALDADPARRRRRRAAAAPRRRAAAVGVALSDAGHGARRRAVPAPPLHGAEPRRARARGRLGAVGGAARAARARPSEIGWFDPAFFVYSDEVDFCKRLARRRLAHALRARAPPPSITSSSPPARCPSGASSSSRATATATCASTTRRPRRWAVRLADGVDLRGARGRRGRRCPATTRAATGAT